MPSTDVVFRRVDAVRHDGGLKISLHQPRALLVNNLLYPADVGQKSVGDDAEPSLNHGSQPRELLNQQTIISLMVKSGRLFTQGKFQRVCPAIGRKISLSLSAPKNRNAYMKRLDKPSKRPVEDLLNIKENSNVSCNLLAIRKLPEYLESTDALFCSGVSELPAMFEKDLKGDKTNESCCRMERRQRQRLRRVFSIPAGLRSSQPFDHDDEQRKIELPPNTRRRNRRAVGRGGHSHRRSRWRRRRRTKKTSNPRCESSKPKASKA